MSRFTTRRALAGSVLAAAALVGGAGVAHAAFGFDDVNEGDTHADGIEWLVANGITTGCDADSYCPQQPVTRAQMATFMHRLAGDDVPASVNAKLLAGHPVGDFVLQPQLVTQVTSLNDDTVENVTVACPGGTTALSGGYEVKASQNGAVSDDWFVMVDRPTDNSAGWTISLRTLDGAAHDAYVTVFANCS